MHGLFGQFKPLSLININNVLKKFGRGCIFKRVTFTCQEELWHVPETWKVIIDEKDRAEIVSSLKSVDLCIIFDELTPDNLIREINPDIYTKGEDYNMNDIAYVNTLNLLKIKTYFIPLIKNKSSTLIIDKIRNSNTI